MPDDTPVRLVVTRGGDPGPEILAALAAVLTRPMVAADPATDRIARPSRWVAAARLESVFPRRRIHDVADL